MSTKTIVVILAVFFVFPLLVIIPPNVIQDMWLWFVMPLSSSLPPLSFWHAFGINMFIGYFSKPFFDQEVTEYIRKDISEDDKIAWVLKRPLQHVFLALFVWGLAALVSYGV